MLLLLVVVFRIGESPKTAAFKVSRVVYVYVLVGCVLCVSVCVCVVLLVVLFALLIVVDISRVLLCCCLRARLRCLVLPHDSILSLSGTGC